MRMGKPKVCGIIPCAALLFTFSVAYYYWVDPSWKLAGDYVPFIGLAGRGFPPWNPSKADLLRTLGVLERARLKYNASVTEYSLHPDIIRRGNFQKVQIQDFCRRRGIPSTLPMIHDLYVLYHHLLYDDSKKLIFCYVPKTGCSNMKRLLLVLNNVLPASSVSEERPPEWMFGKLNSFLGLSASEAHYRLKNYFKVVVVRNPMIRTLSAYRNKIEKPLNYSRRRYFPDDTKLHILELYQKDELHKWLLGDQTTDLHPSFSDYIQWWSEYPSTIYNDHFRTVTELCSPCSVHYDFYANFKVYDYDIYALLDYLDIPKSLYPRVISHPGLPTSEYLNKYYGELSPEYKHLVYNRLSEELDFYYSLYPEETGIHEMLQHGNVM